MRENSVGKAILLSIVTIGIYWLILTYRNTMDIHKAADADTRLPLILYIVSIIFPALWFAVFSLNGSHLNTIRKANGKQSDYMWIIALILSFFLAFIGSIIWAVHYDGTLREMAEAA